LAHVRSIAPDTLLLVPGVGAQGGNFKACHEAAGGNNVIISVSRAILYAANDSSFAKMAREVAKTMHP
jgi:orotidine-5'-phosphate decarboxylase